MLERGNDIRKKTKVSKERQGSEREIERGERERDGKTEMFRAGEGQRRRIRFPKVP